MAFVEFILKGFSLVAQDQRLRKHIWTPALQSSALLFVLIIFSFFILQPIAGWLTGMAGLAWLAGTAAGLLTFVLWWVLLGPVFFTIAMFLSSMSWDKLSLEVERRIRADEVPNHQLTFRTTTKEMIARLPRTIFVAVGCGLLSFVLFGIPSALLAGWQGSIDFTCPAFIRRNIRWPEQMKWVARMKERNGFAIGSAVLAYFPLINLLFLPALVAGGTMMVAKNYPDRPR